MALDGGWSRSYTYLAVIIAVISPPISGAQPKAKETAQCGNANWVCVSECIDVRCIDQCLADRCEAKLKALRACTAEKGCAGNDPTCAKAQCPQQCAAAFARAMTPPPPKVANPCEGKTGTMKLPERLPGGWNLQAATLGAQDRFGQSATPLPRPDYRKVLRIEPSGCFVLETKLEDATLGQGNLLVVRSWGTVEVVTDRRDDDKHTLRLLTEGGQATGQVCGEERVAELEAEKFVRPRYRAELQADRLTLVELSADGQTFQFKKGEPEVLEP